ncbi:class I SAM-dependent methyltransferase [Candidatus Woesearchaeota archaeon]|nr:MAG: class I SAM-dependent methyltransferase [Candidatus Woesearchaeota archaeon]
MVSDASLAKKLYNAHIERYARVKNNYKPTLLYKRPLYSLLKNVSGKKVLFAGCGAGTECVSAVQRGAKVTGIDISDAAIMLAKKTCPKATFYVMDFAKMKFHKRSFDVVIAILSVMYKKDLTATLQEFKRILKPNGSIVLLVPHPVRKMMKYNKGYYFVKGRHHEFWKGTERFNYYLLFEDFIDAFVNAKLKVVKLLEPKPFDSADKLRPELKYPHFIIFKLVQEKI